MQLTIFNGSPRERSGNTQIYIDQFLQGYKSSNNSYQIFYLIENEFEKYQKAFQRANNIILGFPLYTDAMPAIVKAFIEKLSEIKPVTTGTGVGFIVQSGFPEPYHSLFVERYLIKLSRRMHWKYRGTVIKGGGGVGQQPEWLNRKLFSKFKNLGKEYAVSAKFDAEIIKKIAPVDKFSALKLFIIKLLLKSEVLNYPWNKALKANDAFEKRNDRPYHNSL